RLVPRGGEERIRSSRSETIGPVSGVVEGSRVPPRNVVPEETFDELLSHSRRRGCVVPARDVRGALPGPEAGPAAAVAEAPVEKGIHGERADRAGSDASADGVSHGLPPSSQAASRSST